MPGMNEGPVIGHYGDHRTVEVWAPARYRTGPLVGAGRWCPIYAPVGQPPVGILYTDDDQVLGFLPADALESPGAAKTAHTVSDALLGAAAVASPVTVVFDHWAQMDGQGLAAGPVAVGDLSELSHPPHEQDGSVTV